MSMSWPEGNGGHGEPAPWRRTVVVLVLVAAACAALAVLVTWIGNGGRRTAADQRANVVVSSSTAAPDDAVEIANQAAGTSGLGSEQHEAPRRFAANAAGRDRAAAAGPWRTTHRPADASGVGPVIGVTGAGAPDAPAGDEPTPLPEDETPPEPEDEENRTGLAGWVFDEGGSGVPGLAVSADPRRLVQPEHGSFETTVAETDGEGFFAFAGLGDGEYAVTTEATELYEPASGTFRAGENAAVLVARAKAERRGVVRGYVENRDGGSLAGVRVEPVGQFDNRAISDDSGAYVVSLRLDPRQRAQMLSYQLEGFREHRLTIGPSELAPGSEVVRNVVLEPLRDTSTVSGFVAGTDGSPVHRAHVQLVSSSLGRRADGVSGRDGLFSIPDVEHADDYRLWVRPPSGYKDYARENLVVTGWVDLDIVLDEVEWAALEGRMVDLEGRPVPRSTLWLTTAQPRDQRTTPVTGDDLGWFSVARLPEGRAALATRAAPFFTFSGIELLPAETTTVRLRLDTGSGKLAGWVRDASGAPLPLAAAQLLWSSLEDGVRGRSRRDTVSDGNGYFLFTRLGVGPHTLTISADGFQTTRMQVEVTLATDDLMIELSRLPE